MACLNRVIIPAFPQQTDIPGKGPDGHSSHPEDGLNEHLIFSRQIDSHLHHALISRAPEKPDLMRSCMWLQVTPGPLCCLQSTGVLVVCYPAMLLGQDLSFVSLSTPLLLSVTLSEPLLDFISHPVWNSITAAWSWLSCCCLIFSLRGWDVSGICGFPQIAKYLLATSDSQHHRHIHG